MAKICSYEHNELMILKSKGKYPVKHPICGGMKIKTNQIPNVLILFIFMINSQCMEPTTKHIHLENDKVEFDMTLNGSAITNFSLKANPINPLDWVLPLDRLPLTHPGSTFPFQGHFLSLGTWGMPSDGEVKAGIKFYGEVNTEVWNLIESGSHTATTSCLEPVQQFEIKRDIELSPNDALIGIKETITNHLPIGRPYNMLQHATCGGAYVDGKTILDTNADRGFYQNGEYQRATYEDIEQTAYRWPNAQFPDISADLRYTDTIQKTYVSSHIFDNEDKLGWATLANPEAGLLIGYLWHTDDYPWVNFWYQFEDGKVKGRAIEFATCGMWKSFEYMMTHDSRFFGRNSFEFIDAGETKSKEYQMFLIPISAGFKGIQSISKDDEKLTVEMNTEDGIDTIKLTN